ncbi:MAG TPA: hypothetical protein VG167_07275 [Verrucomicrobiae bacterium]|nr:hypothetical protein [Verrucomicrobiae bacterium]
MLTTLTTLHARLALTDSTQDTLLTAALKSLSARFDKLTNRTLARTETATFEFPTGDLELSPPCYPVESVQKFEIKTSELTGWQEITPGPDFLIRNTCIISLRLPSALSLQPLALSRVTYTGGYVLPGTDPAPGQTPLPDDIEQACVEQVAYWFQNRDRQGLKTYWPSGAAYYQFATLDLLDSVKSVLATHTRFTL